MNQNLQSILDFIQQDESLTADEKNALLKSLKEADKELEITAFKLDRTEKVKRTTAILLEETIKELEQKRKAVEAQNRELEIESSLQRVRTVAMGMKKPADMLDVCRIISVQLPMLNVSNIRNIQTAIFYESKGIYLNYEFFSLHDKTVITEVEYNLQPDVKAFVNQMQQDKEAFFTTSFEGHNLKEWVEYQKKTNQFVDPMLKETKSLHYYFYSIGPGALGISTYAPLSEENIAVFKRFRNVFYLAYRRFTDIETAEAQAKEAQIELGLERVRARAMAMQKSDDLASAVAIIFDELEKLNMGMLRCGIGILNKETRSVNVWAATTSDKNRPLQLSGDESMDTHPLLQGAFNAWLKQQDYSYELKGEDLTAYYKAQVSANFHLPDSQSLITGKKGLCQYYFLATFQAGGLFAFRETSFPPDAKKVMKRFAGVLNLTYKRFTDIQNAEKQAREAEIELALERVRARTMAMQKSEELPQAAILLFQQIQALGMPAWSAGYCIWDYDKQGITLWMSSEGVMQPSFHAPLTEDLSFINMKEAFERGDTFHVEEVCAEALVTHYRYMRTLPVVGEVLDSIIAAGHPLPTRQIFHCVYFSQGFLLFITYEPVPEAHEIFKRFGKVFDQTFTRYLDLQKAEAQAREAQIEAALERVRSRTSAMQRSENLFDVIREVNVQLLQLGFRFDSADFVTDYSENGYKIWLASAQETFSTPMYITTSDTKIPGMLKEVLERGDDFFTFTLNREEKNRYFLHVFSSTVAKNASDESKQFIFSAQGMAVSCVVVKNIIFSIVLFSG